MDMEVKTALDKFYNIFDNPQKYDLFFYYNGLRYQLSSGGYILTERAEDCEDEMEYGFDENGKDLASSNQTKTEKSGCSVYGILDTTFESC